MWKPPRKLAVSAIVSFLLRILATDCCAPLICTAQDNNAALFSLKKTIRREISAGQNHSYQVALNSAQYIRAVVDQTAIHVVVTAYGPRGQKIVEMNCRKDGPTPVSLIAGIAGPYRFEMRSLERETATAGSYELRIEEIRAGTAQDRERISAESLFAEAEQLRANGRAESSRAAIAKYAEAAAHWRAVGDKRAEAEALNAIGELYHPLGEPKKALAHYERALILSEELKDVRLRGETLNDIGFVHIQLGATTKALEYCTNALELSREVNNRRGEAAALNNIGEVYYAQGYRQKALDYYKQALPIWLALGDRQGQAQTLLYLGYSHSELSDTKEAFRCYNQALSLWRDLRDPRGEMQTLNALGNLCSKTGKKQEALDFHIQARRFVRLIGDPIEEARVLIGIASVYDELGEKHKTLEYYDQALRLYRGSSNQQGEVVALILKSGVYSSIREFQKALIHLQTALGIIRASNDKRYESYALKSIAAVYDSLGQEKRALDSYNQGLTIYRTVGDLRGEAYALNGIGSIYDRAGEKGKALDYQNQALRSNRAAGDRFGEVSTLFNIARIERDLGKLTQARAHIADATSKIESLRADVASQELRASFMATVRQNYELQIDVLMRLHKAGAGEGLDAEGLHTSERGRARSLIEMLAEAREDIRRGVDASLLDRERELQRLLTDKEERYSMLLTGKHTEEQASAATKEIEAVRTDYQQVQAQIRAASPRYAAIVQPQPLSVTEIQQQVLDPETLLLEYSLGEDRSYLWAVTPNSLSSFELPKRAEVEAAARRVYELLTARSQIVVGETELRKERRVARADAEYSNASAALSQMVLGPVASQLGVKRLLIVADGALQYIPFNALPAPADPGRAPVTSGKTAGGGHGATDGAQPLIADHEVISLPSASALAVLRHELAGRKPALKAVAVLADPVFSRDDPRLRAATSRPALQTSDESLPRDFERAIKEARLSRNGTSIPRLPFSLREAAAIKSAAPAGEAMEAVGFDASRATAMSPELSQYRIVHFATHGLLNSEHPELSGIVLSLVDRQGKRQNGFLRLHEVYDLNLPAELVVLSACQTGLGKEVKGEGLVGLTRGFMYAGAARVMSSLWKVDDSATAQLMTRFYAKMLGDGLRPAAALREAQVEMSKQKRQQTPYYWAGFMLQGEWR